MQYIVNKPSVVMDNKKTNKCKPSNNQDIYQFRIKTWVSPVPVRIVFCLLDLLMTRPLLKDAHTLPRGGICIPHITEEQN